MDVMRNALAFPMYGAAVWLLWVMSLQAGSDGVLRVGAGFVLVGFAAWVVGIARSGRRRFASVVATMALVAAVSLLPGITESVSGTASTTAGSEAFTPSRLAQLRAEGRPVFVNMTAAWCVTCLVNERVTLSSDAVRQAFSDHHVAYLKGDWTRSDPAITAYLQEFARDGVPLYVFYPGGSTEPSILPQLLTQADVLGPLNQTGR
jgi:thiol:disulfide interchange protein DsbD